MIPIVDDGNDAIEVPPGLVARFLGGGAVRRAWPCGGRGYFVHKARNDCLLCRKSLVGENRIQLAGLSDEAKTRDKDSLPTPLVQKRDQLLCEGIHATRWAWMQTLPLRFCCLLKQDTVRVPP